MIEWPSANYENFERIKRVHYDSAFLETILFFSGLEEEILQRLQECSYLKEYNEGEILYYEKEKSDNLYFVIKGGLKFYKVDRFDNEIFLYQLKENSFVFDVAKFCEEGRFVCYANAEFTKKSLVINLESRSFREILNSSNELMKRVLKEALLTISELQCIINRDIVFDGTAKVAHMLATDLEEFNRLKKHEIAYKLHIQPETLSRILRKLTRNGAVLVEKNIVIVKDIEALYEIFK